MESYHIQDTRLGWGLIPKRRCRLCIQPLSQRQPTVFEHLLCKNILFMFHCIVEKLECASLFFGEQQKENTPLQMSIFVCNSTSSPTSDILLCLTGTADLLTYNLSCIEGPASPWTIWILHYVFLLFSHILFSLLWLLYRRDTEPVMLGLRLKIYDSLRCSLDVR